MRTRFHVVIAFDQIAWHKRSTLTHSLTGWAGRCTDEIIWIYCGSTFFDNISDADEDASPFFQRIPAPHNGEIIRKLFISPLRFVFPAIFDCFLEKMSLTVRPTHSIHAKQLFSFIFIIWRDAIQMTTVVVVLCQIPLHTNEMTSKLVQQLCVRRQSYASWATNRRHLNKKKYVFCSGSREISARHICSVSFWVQNDNSTMCA